MRPQPVIVAALAAIAGAFATGAGTFAELGSELRLAILFLALLLLLFALWVFLVARRPHPHIRRHKIVRLKLAEIEARARAGEPFELPLGTTRVEVVVRPQPVTTETAAVIGGRAGADGPAHPPRPVGDIVTFAGTVAGAKDSEVRLTITDAWLRGYVLTGEDWWFIEPLRKFRIEAQLDEYLVYRTRDLRFRLEFGQDYKPRKVEGGQGGGGLDPPHRVNPVVPVAMVHDEQYSAQAGGRPYDYQQSLINDVNGLYSRIGVEFRISVFIWTVNWLTSTNAERMLDQVEDAVRTLWTDLRPVANRRAFGTEVAHATTGKELDGNTLGIAWQPGVYGLSQQQLIWIGGGGLFGGPPNLAFQNMMIAAHELGHNFDGAHEEADEWCVAHFIWCWDFVRTLMWPTFYGDNVPRFSDGTRNASNNNADRVSTNMATGRNGNF